MIFVSSACVGHLGLDEGMRTLHQYGFASIECSGGPRYEHNAQEILLQLRRELRLDLLCHNYFPVPETPFVLNLASSDENIYKRSIDQIKKALDLSRTLGAGKLACHAGFFLDITAREIGNTVSSQPLMDERECTQRFIDAFERLKQYSGGIKLYIENNVLSKSNRERFGPRPFMLLHSRDVHELRQRMAFDLLLDVGHLKVSCASLGLDFEKELDYLVPSTDYIHISDNDGLADQNRRLSSDSKLWRALQRFDLKNKTITLEIYEGLDAVRESYDLLMEAVRC